VKLEAGTIQKKHIFIVKKDGDKIVMEKREYKDAETVDDQDLLKRGQKSGLSERNEYISQSYLEQCTLPGLREIKQVELYTKWRMFVPSQYRDIICPKPSDDVLGRVKTDWAVKTKQRAGTAGKKKQKSAQEKENAWSKKVTDQAKNKQDKTQAKAAKDATSARVKQDKTEKAGKKKNKKRKCT
jgi:hypothetical protein